jgi:ubiquinone/menaquinone biosynthesis C-methylase UbiE
MIGLISQDLVPHASKTIGLDTSQGMVNVYNQKATTNGVSSKMFALCIDILSSSEIPQELQNVDVVVCSMAYHHIEDIDHTSKVLASLLKKGGHLLVVDLLESPSPSQRS